MRRTLLLIPHELGPLPVFGFGWVMILLGLVILFRIVWSQRSNRPIGELITSEGLLSLIAIGVVGFVLPRTELQNAYGEPVGMAIRGYGVMLLLGVGSAIALAAYRAKQRGLDPDLIYSIAPWAFIGGILGARLFYVIQYRDQFIGGSIFETISRMLRFTEGGLVVYGSIIGGTLAVLSFLYRHRLSPLKFGDVIVPCIFLGIFFGRMGCLMNGCCYGGRCEPSPIAVQFPPQSKVYADQVQSGELLGFQFDETTRKITSVTSNSIAEKKGMEVGQRLREIVVDFSDVVTLQNKEAIQNIPYEDLVGGVAIDLGNHRVRVASSEMPLRALPVAAVQIISSLTSLALCLGLCFLSRFQLRTGMVLFIGFAAYAILRFILEMIRVDEQGQFGTSFSISQWVSIFVLGGAIVGMIWLRRANDESPPSPVQTPMTE